VRKGYQICTRCIMDTSEQEIQFDEKGICNHCKSYEERARKEVYLFEAGQKKLKRLADEIKENGKNKEYDCILGLSGGMDSSMVAYLVKKLGLRPLAIHLDNGWNTEVSVQNIENLVKNLNIDLHTYATDWEEFKDLQLSFLKASVINCEIPTDHAIVAILYRTAAKKGLRYIMSGGNIVTEGIMPESWGYDPKDWRHIKGIHKRFGREPLKSFPRLILFDWVYYTFLKRVKFIPILNYYDYSKKEAAQILENELGWKNYGGKHFESIYTRFFQAYILPKKFNIDKRRAHLSTLICSGQLSREQALKEIEADPYPLDLFEKDREYVLSKLGLTDKEFEEIMSFPVHSYKDYPNNYFWFENLNFFVRLAKRMATYN